MGTTYRAHPTNTLLPDHPFKGSGHHMETWHGYRLRPEQAIFLDLIVNHGLDPITACTQLGHKPSLIMSWRRDEDTPDFRAAYGLAREMQAMHEVRDAKTALVDAQTEIKGLAGEDIKKAAAVANLARSMSDHHKWMAGKLDSDSYGDRTKVENTHRVEAVVLLPALTPPPPPPVAQLSEAECVELLMSPASDQAPSSTVG